MSVDINREQTANTAIRAALAQAKAADVPTIDLAEALALLRVFGAPGVRADVADSGGGADALRQAQGEGGEPRAFRYEGRGAARMTPAEEGTTTLRQAQGEEEGEKGAQDEAPAFSGTRVSWGLPAGVSWDGEALRVDLGAMTSCGYTFEGGCMVFRPAARTDVDKPSRELRYAEAMLEGDESAIQDILADGELDERAACIAWLDAHADPDDWLGLLITLKVVRASSVPGAE